jgi:hypothetical protein
MKIVLLFVVLMVSLCSCTSKEVYNSVQANQRYECNKLQTVQRQEPKDMAFVEDKDPKKKGHYFLTVTEPITIYRLVQNLKWIADRMTVIRNAERAL